MKANYITLLFLTLTFCVFSQEDSLLCAFDLDETNYSSTQVIDHSGSIDPAVYQDAEPLVLNVFFWGVNRPQGDNLYHLDTQQALAGVANLNLAYNQFNIYFKYKGWEEFNSPEIEGDSNGYHVLESSSQFGQLVNWAKDNGYYDDKYMNVYAYGWANGFGGIAAGLGSNICGISLLNITNGSTKLQHEIGHDLGLRHTRSSSERVTRDPNDSNFNALDAGDEILDTAANPGFYRNANCSGDGSDPDCYPWITEDCTYDIASTDQDNSNPPVDYKVGINPEDVINMLSDAYICQENYLSPGQGVYMRETIEQHEVFEDVLTDVATLYKPYEGEYYFAGPYNPSLHNPRFQPGFEYFFIECGDDYPMPTGFDDTSFSYNTNNVLLNIDKNTPDYHGIVHPNHSAIYIKNQLGANEAFPQPRKCYDNFNRKPTGGLIIKFNDGVLNTNVTITPQDSTAINSPNLIQDLENGLYKIEKIYNDGETEENLLQKGNN